MIQTEGFLSLWKGLIPSLIQIIPYSGLQFAGRSVLETGWIEAGLKEGEYISFLNLQELTGLCNAFSL